MRLCYTTNPYKADYARTNVVPNVIFATAYQPAIAPIVANLPVPQPGYPDQITVAVDAAWATDGQVLAVLLAWMELPFYKPLFDRFRKNTRMIGYGSREADSREKRIDKWMLNKTHATRIIRKCLGFDLDEESTSGARMEMFVFSPPLEQWSDSVSVEERHMAGLFMYLKRNPITVLSSMNLIPFASIYNFSQAFDLYFQLSAARNRQSKGDSNARGKVQSLLIKPLSISRHYPDYSKPGRQNSGWLLPIADYASAVVNGLSTDRYADRTVVRITRADKPGEPLAWQILSPTQGETSIPHFYDRKSGMLHNNQPFGLISPTPDQILDGVALYAYPLFGMYVRMLDQYGIALRNELKARLEEVRYDKPESLARHQNALVQILGQR